MNSIKPTGSGWFKLHRSICEWEWYSDHNTTRLFIHLLAKANHSATKYRGQNVSAGEVLTGRKLLSNETGLSEQQIRSCISKLKSTGEITIKPFNKYSIISVKNWIEYQQVNQQTTQQVTNSQPTSNQQVTTSKNDKNKKNEKKHSGIELIIESRLTEMPEQRALAYRKWFAYKKEIRKPYTSEIGIKGFFTKTERDFAETGFLEASVTASVANGYQGLYPDKEYASSQAKQKTGASVGVNGQKITERI